MGLSRLQNGVCTGRGLLNSIGMYIHNFKRHYDLDLIPASHSDISLGDLVWRRAKKRPLMSRRGMPNHIYNVFLMEGIVSERQWREAISVFESEELQAAQLGNLQVEADRRFGLSFNHPIVKLLQSDATLKSQIKFSFHTIQARVLSNKWRVILHQNLEKLSPEAEKKIFKRYRPVHLITELYYGNIYFKTDRSFRKKIDLLLDTNRSERPLSNYEQGRFQVYEFDHNLVPFAMRLEPLNDFNG